MDSLGCDFSVLQYSTYLWKVLLSYEHDSKVGLHTEPRHPQGWIMYWKKSKYDALVRKDTKVHSTQASTHAARISVIQLLPCHVVKVGISSCTERFLPIF
jgi:hypothetical protein